MANDRSKKDQLREHVSREIIEARHQLIQCQIVLRELGIKTMTARKNLRNAESKLSKSTLHLQEVENGTYQAPLFDRHGDAMPRGGRRIADQSRAEGTFGNGPPSIASGSLTHGPQGKVSP